MSVQSSVFHGSPIKLFVPMAQSKEGQTQSTSGPRHGSKGPKGGGAHERKGPSTALGEQARREVQGKECSLAGWGRSRPSVARASRLLENATLLRTLSSPKHPIF